MRDGFMVDHTTMGTVWRELRGGHRVLEELGDSVPDAPDAGEVTGALAGALTHLVAAAGQYSTGLALAGDAVRETQRDYLATDDAWARTFSRIF
jgi:hypothetical protein